MRLLINALILIAGISASFEDDNPLSNFNCRNKVYRALELKTDQKYYENSDSSYETYREDLPAYYLDPWDCLISHPSSRFVAQIRTYGGNGAVLKIYVSINF
jgi:hypothetical protein